MAIKLEVSGEYGDKRFMTQATHYLTLSEFLSLPDTEVACELVAGQAIPKMSPKRFHAAIQTVLLNLLQAWGQERGWVYPEWAIVLKRQGENWVPVPDLTYVSYTRLAADWLLDEACPVAPELVVEIISPGQTFGEMVEKATDYLQAGVSRVWIVDARARSITVFYPDAPPRTYTKTSSMTDPLLENLQFTPQQLFQQARLPD